MIKPRSIRLEVSSHCQLRCPSCPTTSKAIHPAIGSGFLKFSDFRKLLDDNPWLEEIELSNYGEIFLNPELLDILAYAHIRGVTLSADNGVNLNHVRPEVLEGLVKHRFRSMLCSIDGASQETYGVYRKRGSFDRVIENIRAMNRHKEEQASPYPLLGWQFIVFGHNQHEIHAAKKLATELGMSFVLKLSWDESFSPVRRPEELKRQLRIRSISREEFRREHGRDYMQSLCEQLWSAPQINWDGRVLGCCRNFWGDFGGNAFRDGLSASINNEKITYARAMLSGQSEPRPDMPCSTCDIYVQRRSTKQWVTRSVATNLGRGR